MADGSLITGVVPLGNVSGVVPIDASKGSAFLLTLTGDAALSVRSLRPGVAMFVGITQGGGGGHACTWSGAGGQIVTGAATGSLNVASTGTTWVLLTGTDVALATVDVVANTAAASSSPPSGPTFLPLAQVTADFGPSTTGSDSTFADVPGLSKSFTTTAVQTVRAWTKGCFSLTGSNVYMRILLDGAPVTFDGTHPSISRFSGAVTDDPGLMVEQAAVAAGPHVVKAQFACAGQIFCRPVSGFETMALAVVLL